MKQLSITGHLGGDATTEEYKEGKHAMKMSVYVKGQKQDETTIVEVIKYSNEKANNLSLFTTGSLVEATGFPKNSAYIDKENKARVSEQLISTTVSLLSNPKKDGGQPES